MRHLYMFCVNKQTLNGSCVCMWEFYGSMGNDVSELNQQFAKNNFISDTVYEFFISQPVILAGYFRADVTQQEKASETLLLLVGG